MREVSPGDLIFSLERHIEKPLSLVLGLGFMSQTKELFRNAAILFGCGHAVLLLPFGQPIVQGICNRLLRLFERVLSCSAIVAGQASRIARAAAYACPDGPPRDVESGGLPLAVANLEVACSAGIRGIGGAASRAAAVRTFHQL